MRGNEKQLPNARNLPISSEKIDWKTYLKDKIYVINNNHNWICKLIN